jgi:uncharacterized protein
MEKLVRILSLDGGGIKGIMTGEVLIRLEEKIQTLTKNPDARLGQYFDLIAGTSTGGILTSLLLCPDPKDPKKHRYSTVEAVDLYRKNGRTIFKRTLSGRLPGRLAGLFGSKFYGHQMEKLLTTYFGDLRLSQLLKPCLISSYDIEQRKAIFFTSHDAKEKPQDDFLISDVARATSAAPTFFPPASTDSLSNLLHHNIDGGLFANNPTMCALIEAAKIFKDEDGELFSPDEMYILSVGTGAVKKIYPYKKAVKWGLVSWIAPIIDIMMSGASETVDYQIGKIFKILGKPDQYHRIMPDLNLAAPEMDNVSPENIEALRQAGILCADKNDELLEKIAKVLIENQASV